MRRKVGGMNFEVGKCYVDKHGSNIRKILSTAPMGGWAYHHYVIEGGRPLGRWECTDEQMTRFAGREATADEVARLDRVSADEED
jgi:hypothetical protein